MGKENTAMVRLVNIDVDRRGGSWLASSQLEPFFVSMLEEIMLIEGRKYQLRYAIIRGVLVVIYNWEIRQDSTDLCGSEIYVVKYLVRSCVPQSANPDTSQCISNKLCC